MEIRVDLGRIGVRFVGYHGHVAGRGELQNALSRFNGARSEGLGGLIRGSGDHRCSFNEAQFPGGRTGEAPDHALGRRHGWQEPPRNLRQTAYRFGPFAFADVVE